MNRHAILATVLIGTTCTGVAHAQTMPAPAPSKSDVLVFPASYFAEAQPATAYDMILRVPGFLFDAGDAGVRGLAGSTGNVLIDGRRPAAKEDTLDAILKRIPASAVLRIELIRGGANGIDVQGQPVLANIVRRNDVAVRGQIEGNFARYGDGRLAPSLRVDLSRRGVNTLTEGSLSFYQTIDDEKGRGPRIRLNANGSLRESARYDERDKVRGAQFSLGREQPLAGGQIRLNGSFKRERESADTVLTFLAPTPGLERVVERETVDNIEIGGEWTRSLGPKVTLELTGLKRWSTDRSRETSDDGADIDDVAESATGGESIGRALLRWQPSSTWSVEGGGEVAFNYLDSQSSLTTNGVRIPLPAASVRVAERRGEAFVATLWRPNPKLTIDLGLRVEVSTLTQSGDSSLRKSFVFPKPRLALSWSPSARTQWRLQFDREIGQLDFGDFVSSTSLTSGTITAGNANLEPQRAWVASLAWERRFWKQGALVLTARHQWISRTLDRVGIVGPGYAFDAPGNIGTGSKTKIAASLSLPLDRLGLRGGLLKADVGYRWTSVIDPTTNLRRRISGEEPFDGEIHFTQDFAKAGFRWGADYVLGKDEYEFRFNEIKRSRVQGRLSLFAEYKVNPRWTIRASIENVTGRNVERDRAIYAGARDVNPLRYNETRVLRTRPLIGLSLRRRLGN